jgi:hypothetical protein
VYSTYSVTLRSVRANVAAVEKQWVSHIVSVCVCERERVCVCVCVRVCVCVCVCVQPYLSSMQCACTILPAPICSNFPHYRINGTIFGKQLLNLKRMFWFPLQLLCATFLILRRTERDMIKKMSSWCDVKYQLFLSDFSEAWIFSTVFRKILKYKVS